MMFARLLWKLLRGNPGRLAVALIAVISGAAVISALLNLAVRHRAQTDPGISRAGSECDDRTETGHAGR